MPKQSIIDQLYAIRGLKFECPNPSCNEQSTLKSAKLFDLRRDYPKRAASIITVRQEAAKQLMNDVVSRAAQLESDKLTRPARHERGAHHSNLGKGIEQVIPAFIGFPYEREDCRTLLQPVDYLVFRGLSDYGRIEAIHFVEVKTGNGRLNPQEASVRSAVHSGRVSHKVIG